MHLPQYLILIVGTIPMSEPTQESTTTSDNGDMNEVRPVEEQSEMKS